MAIHSQPKQVVLYRTLLIMSEASSSSPFLPFTHPMNHQPPSLRKPLRSVVTPAHIRHIVCPNYTSTYLYDWESGKDSLSWFKEENKCLEELTCIQIKRVTNIFRRDALTN